jgi:hypothetical protein
LSVSGEGRYVVGGFAEGGDLGGVKERGDMDVAIAFEGFEEVGRASGAGGFGDTVRCCGAGGWGGLWFMGGGEEGGGDLM